MPIPRPPAATLVRFARHAATAAALFALFLSGASAQSFQQALEAARLHDAQYSAQVAAAANKRLQSNQASTAFYPYATAVYSKSDVSADTANSETRYVSLNQPILSYDRFLTLQQSDPLAGQAQADLDQADNDLALRVFTAMADIVRYREQIRALGVQIDGLDEQLRRSTRMRELGQGTVTEVSDFQVRVAIAQANRVSLRNSLQAAERNFTLVTGLAADTANLEVQVPEWNDERALEELLVQVRETAPAVRSAKYNVELAEIAAKRVTAQYLPQVVAQVSKGQRTGTQLDSSPKVAITFSAPIGTSPYYDYQRAANDVLQKEEGLRYTQDSVANELTRLHLANSAYKDEIRIREQALEGARLSVDGNIKSYQGGVKTNIDVITSYQTLADAEVSLANSKIALAESALRLKLLASGRTDSPN
ncbi:TolC family protein [uncultured Pseudacidovorax sp.]|uniref:TolC family protein n=1 Tax=uncultured Pseudacidovorax sp. TaxID=679313 RepID=UPI0025F46FD8|nr:TolC family protein [uncultured Pseudacidovorax sp.]